MSSTIRAVKQAVGTREAKTRQGLFATPLPDRSTDPARIHLVSCIGVDLEAAMLGHFVDHYRALGVPVGNMHLVFNASSADCEGLVIARDILDERGLTAEEIWIGGYSSERMWQKRRDVQRRCVPEGHWVISADVDEFHEYPAELSWFLAECTANGINCIDGVFVDRVSEDGALSPVAPDCSPFVTFPRQGMVQGGIVPFGQFHKPFGSVKLMAFDAGLLPDRGGHGLVAPKNDAVYIFGRPLPEHSQITNPTVRFRIPLRVHHFKWNSTLLQSLENRTSASEVSQAGLEYGRKLLDYFAVNHGIRNAHVAWRERDGSYETFDWRTRVRFLRLIHFFRRRMRRLKFR